MLLVVYGIGLALMACSSDDNEEMNTPIVDNPDLAGYVEGAICRTKADSKSHEDIYRFFDKELPTTSMSYTKNCFLFEEASDVCYKVNSYDELRSIYTGSEALPDIDFETYTLLVGMKESEQFAADSLNRQMFYEKDGAYYLDIFFSSDLYFQTFVKVYYWGLYPKLGDGKIFVNLINE